MHGHLNRKLSANLYVLLCVQWKIPDDGQRNCPKHVDFYSKNKFEKLVPLVGFIIRIYRKSHQASWFLYVCAGLIARMEDYKFGGICCVGVSLQF